MASICNRLHAGAARLLLFALLATGASTAWPQPSAPAPQLRIESFAPLRGYAVGTQTLHLVGTIRNVGTAPSPADTTVARVMPLAGLEYAEGEMAPKVPALRPGEAFTARWMLRPAQPNTPLVAALVLQTAGEPPQTRVLPIQQFENPPPGDTAAFSPVAAARSGAGSAVIENAFLRARIHMTNAGLPALFLSARAGGAWRQVGVSVPLAEVCSAEGGQVAWWEVFRGNSFQVRNARGEATLTLVGGFGLRWRATLDLTLHDASRALDVRLRLSALRPLRLEGVRLTPLMAGLGSFGADARETLPPTPNAVGTVAALRWGEYTVGCLWDTRFEPRPLRPAPIPEVPGAEYRLIGLEALPTGTPSLESPGALIEWRARLLALTGTSTVQSAIGITFEPPPPMAAPERRSRQTANRKQAPAAKPKGTPGRTRSRR